MIPFPFIVLGISATTLGVRHLRKKDQCNTVKEVDENRKRIEMWCKSEGLVSTSDGTFDLNAHLSNGNPLIIESLIQDFENTFEFLIEQKVDVNAMNSEGKTGLFYCKNSDQIEKLIKAGADVNARDLLGKTALFYCKTVDLAKVFVTAGIDVNAQDLQGKTALFDCRNVQIADVLLKNGADLLIQDDEGKTVLHTMSFEVGDLEYSLSLTKIYVAHTQKLLNIVDNSGKKAAICDLYLKEDLNVLDDDKTKLEKLPPDELLDDAVVEGNYFLAIIALERGANPNCRDRCISIWNMLFLAVRNNNPELIPLLIQYGGNVNEIIDQICVLNKAILDYHPECVKMLLDCGAKIDEGIIRTAKCNKHPEIYSMICKTDKMPPCEDIPKDVDLKRCSIGMLNHYLVSAIKDYDIEAVHRLLSAGANPNSQENGDFAILVAVNKNAPDIIQLLVDAGVDINKKYEHDFTALYYACYHHHDRCVELLLELGAKGEGYELEHSECVRIREIWRKYKSSSEKV